MRLGVWSSNTLNEGLDEMLRVELNFTTMTRAMGSSNPMTVAKTSPSHHVRIGRKRRRLSGRSAGKF